MKQTALLNLNKFTQYFGILELNSKGLHQSSGKQKESCCLLFPSSIKREIKQFYVVVEQRRQRNVQKKRDARAKLLFC